MTELDLNEDLYLSPGDDDEVWDSYDDEDGDGELDGDFDDEEFEDDDEW